MRVLLGTFKDKVSLIETINHVRYKGSEELSGSTVSKDSYLLTMAASTSADSGTTGILCIRTIPEVSLLTARGYVTQTQTQTQTQTKTQTHKILHSQESTHVSSYSLKGLMLTLLIV